MRSQEKFRHSKIRFTDRDKVQDFSKETTTGVIHFAASKAVGESVENHIILWKQCQCLGLCTAGIAENDGGKLYFSSSCTFTVKPKNADYWRCIDSKAMSPYGNTKQIGEEIITDVAKVSHIKWSYCAILTDRAHPSAEIENYLLEYLKT
jgi:UDP-glucose 4-epimerase